MELQGQHAFHISSNSYCEELTSSISNSYKKFSIMEFIFHNSIMGFSC